MRRWAIRHPHCEYYLTEGRHPERWGPLGDKTRTWRTRLGAEEVSDGMGVGIVAQLSEDGTREEWALRQSARPRLA